MRIFDVSEQTPTSTRRLRAAGDVVVLAVSILVLWTLSPRNVVSTSTPGGGDLGAHVWALRPLRAEAFASGWPSAWSMDWFAGFPVGHFYFPAPFMAISVLDTFLPLGTAFKIIASGSVVLLPVAAYMAARSMQAARPTPALAALSMGSFLLFMGNERIIGGNLQSLLAGEFAYSMAILLAVLGAAAAARARDPRRSLLAVLLLSAAILSHIVVAPFALVFAVAVSSVAVRRLQMAVVAVVPVAIAFAWIAPFLWRRSFITDPGFVPVGDFAAALFPRGMWWLGPAVAVGVWSALRLDVMAFGALSFGAAALLAFFLVGPLGVPLWNARLLPIWYLSIHLLAAVGAGVAIRHFHWHTALRWIPASLMVFGLLFSLSNITELRSRADLVFGGYEAAPGYPEYKGLVSVLADLEPGRLVWESSSRLIEYGSPFALMLLPYWTDGQITTAEGLYIESSITAPFVARVTSELSTVPRYPIRTVPRGSLRDFNAGVSHLQMLGVRYYITHTAAAGRLANSHPDLRFVAAAQSPLDEPVISEWRIYEVASSDLVAGVDVPIAPTSPDQWQGAVLNWFVGEPDILPVKGTDMPGTDSSSAVQVTDITVGRDVVTFRVDRTGVPVLVKVSYFPWWQATGADGPWQAATGGMVVVPTDYRVTLSVSRRPIDHIGRLVSVVAVLSIVVVSLIARLGPRRRPDQADTADR